ncbi:hypothetical protein BUALT_Bualt07G0049900 [Buddleja alternifolia]|uniref:RING-type domain-containing protein n=1 Tax=Buddleja alternifolia TaxID=168488 RepID=A0AAV6XG08_9LAMI|nr:hypothetical protein BUALT_Bualt07G0049900 [Buddleja alternifolia]
MISDSIPNASIAMASSNPKDFAKKKRANRSAKLKQCKLDARREQWLSQVKKKNGCKEEIHGEGDTPRESVHSKNGRSMPIEKLEIKPRGEEEIYADGSPMHHYSDFESFPSNSPTSHTSSLLGSHDSGSMGEEDEEDVGDDGCLDDWEAVTDALAAATDDNQQEHNPNSGLSSEKHGNSAKSDTGFAGKDILNAKQASGGTAVQRNSVKAWRVDDAFRPLGLPNLTKQYSFPLNSERHFERGVSVWGCKNGGPVPTSCPICCENLDVTDSIFLPCSCGFRLCLFCHKRILEDDGRCPGCRKQYDCDSVEGEATLDGSRLTGRLARSCSMIPRKQYDCDSIKGEARLYGGSLKVRLARSCSMITRPCYLTRFVERSSYKIGWNMYYKSDKLFGLLGRCPVTGGIRALAPDPLGPRRGAMDPTMSENEPQEAAAPAKRSTKGRLDDLDQETARLTHITETLEEKVEILETDVSDLQGQLAESRDVCRTLSKTLRANDMTAVRCQMEEMTIQIGLLQRAVNTPVVVDPAPRLRIPEPRAYEGARDAKEVENFLFDMEQYFIAANIVDEPRKVSTATMYLMGDAKLWWRAKYADIQANRLRLDTWDRLQEEIR